MVRYQLKRLSRGNATSAAPITLLLWPAAAWAGLTQQQIGDVALTPPPGAGVPASLVLRGLDGRDLTQVLRLCLPGRFDPKIAGAGLLGLLARAADMPDFATLDAHVAETQAKVRRCFERIVGEGVA